MRSLSDKILHDHVDKSTITFVGQAGFVFKSQTGHLLGLDLYLSDCGERKYGFKRLMPKLITPEDIVFDAILCSHEHYDHFDVDAVPLLLANSKTTLIAANDCRKLVERLELTNKKIRYMAVGDSIIISDFTIHSVWCDHGVDTPDAVGFIIEYDGIRVYYAGDTCLRKDKAEDITRVGPIDVMIAPINGAFGNMNEIEMAEYAGLIKPRLTIPCHYWNWAEHGGNPGVFAEEMNRNYPGQKYLIMAQGEIFEI